MLGNWNILCPCMLFFCNLLDITHWKAKQESRTEVSTIWIITTEPYSPIPSSFLVSLQQPPVFGLFLFSWMQQALMPSMIVTVVPTRVAPIARVPIRNSAIVHGGSLHSVGTRIEENNYRFEGSLTHAVCYICTNYYSFIYPKCTYITRNRFCMYITNLLTHHTRWDFQTIIHFVDTTSH